jgi:inosine-uridine nucleoside N-ribohydrolase
VPVAGGAPRPLIAERRIADDVHGESALDGTTMPSGESIPLAGEHAVDLMARMLREQPPPVTLIPTGPLTNIALLLRRHHELVDRIGQIVLMAGRWAPGIRLRWPSSTLSSTRRPRTSRSAAASRSRSAAST